MNALVKTGGRCVRASPADIVCFVFDLDGTLSDTWPVALAAFQSAIQGVAGRSFSDRELMALAGPAEEGILQQLIPDDWETCFARYIEGYRRGLSDHEVLFPGVFDLVTTMKRCGTTLAVNSGKTLAAVQMTLQAARIEDCFVHVRGGSAAGDRKAQNLVEIAREIGLDRSRMAYVGDSVGDVVAAKSVGVLAVGAAWAGTADAAGLAAAEADLVFASIETFRAWLCLPPG